MEDTKKHEKPVVIIGAGPAGLTAAYQLCKSGIRSIIIEQDNTVGGLSRTVKRDGFNFDIGGHRFFTKSKEVENLWEEVLKEDFLTRKRLSRIYYNKKFFYYPFKVTNAIFGLGIINSFLIVTSYIKSQVFPELPEKTFEKWVSNRFGKRLYKLFFKSYTEKVWGIPCNEISAEWAAQRIRGLSLLSALKNALLRKQSTDKQTVVKTLIDSFKYPKLGPGMMWEKVASIVESNGSKINFNSGVSKINWDKDKIISIEINHNGTNKIVDGEHFISSMPIRELIQRMDPPVKSEILEAATNLNYRDFITVAIVVNKEKIFPDNWIYIHDPNVKVGRIQNFKNWSPSMVPDNSYTCLGLEYFCFEGDGFWNKSEDELVEIAKNELEYLGFIAKDEAIKGYVVKMPKAYPVYDPEYKKNLNIIKNFLSNIPNIQLVGRNGMHKYNNQDHSMLTSMLAVKNILGSNYDLWQINVDENYHEEITETEASQSQLSLTESTQPLVPSTIINNNKLDEIIIRAFAPFDKFSLALSVGITASILMFCATLWLILIEPSMKGPTLVLLKQYFIGYSISFEGAFIGAIYCFFWGFIFGWLFGYLRNMVMGLYIFRVKKISESNNLKEFLDYI